VEDIKVNVFNIKKFRADSIVGDALIVLVTPVSVFSFSPIHVQVFGFRKIVQSSALFLAHHFAHEVSVLIADDRLSSSAFAAQKRLVSPVPSRMLKNHAQMFAVMQMGPVNTSIVWKHA